MGFGLTYPAIHPERDVVLVESAARTTAVTGATMTNHHARGILLTVVISAVTDTPALTPEIEYSPDGGTTWVNYCVVTTPLATVANSSYLIYPGILASADGAMTESFNLPLPRTWRLNVAVGDTDSATYAIYGQYL